MAHDGYLCLNGQELVNSGRMCDMLASGHGPEGIECQNCCPCDGIDQGLGHAGGYNPAESPWYEPTEPDSWGIAGLLVTSIAGLGPGEITRTVNEAVKVGAIIGQERQLAPQITVTGLVMASTCCGAEYFVQWLRAALRNTCGGVNCLGSDLVFLACEPETPDLDCPENANFDFEAWLTPYVRTMKNVSLISGPTVTQIIPRGCPGCYECGLMEVQFTLAAGDPCVYTEPVSLGSGIFTHVDDDECVHFISKFATIPCADCADLSDCATDPDCQDVDPPSFPALQNSCTTDCIGDEVSRFCFTVPAGTFPVNGAGTVTLDIFAGDAALRNIRIQAWNNPLGLAVEDLAECDACSELNISYVAPDSTLRIDGTNRTAIISCPGGKDVRANQFISSGTNSPAFQFPEFEGCGGPYTVCVTVKEPVSPQAFVSVINAVGRLC